MRDVPTKAPPGWGKQYNQGETHQSLSATPTPFIWTVWTQMMPFVHRSLHSARFELRKGEPVVSSGPRAELSEAGLEPYRRDRWYGFSICLPSEHWSKHDPSGEVLVQWHQNFDNGSPPFAIVTENGNWKLDWHTSHTADPPDADVAGSKDCGPYDVDRWTDWVVHAQWNLEGDAIIDVWMDGEQELHHTGRNVYQNPTPGQPDPGRERVYMKFGIYKWTWDDDVDDDLSKSDISNTTVRVVYHDELRIADGEALRSAGRDGELEVAPWTSTWSLPLWWFGSVTFTFYRYSSPRISWSHAH